MAQAMTEVKIPELVSNLGKHERSKLFAECKARIDNLEEQMEEHRKKVRRLGQEQGLERTKQGKYDAVSPYKDKDGKLDIKAVMADKGKFKESIADKLNERLARTIAGDYIWILKSSDNMTSLYEKVRITNIQLTPGGQGGSLSFQDAKTGNLLTKTWSGWYLADCANDTNEAVLLPTRLDDNTGEVASIESYKLFGQLHGEQYVFMAQVEDADGDQDMVDVDKMSMHDR